LLFVAAAPFLPAALFCAFVPPRDEVERDDEAELLEPPDEDRDELELFFAPPLLLRPEPDDEREVLDFLVVAMQIIPPIISGMFLHEHHRAKCVPIVDLYQLKTARK
jgi:hypothetical protein